MSECVVCGGVNDSRTGLSYCVNCARETWNTAVLVRFIEQIIDLTDRVAEANQVIATLRRRILELERH